MKQTTALDMNDDGRPAGTGDSTEGSRTDARAVEEFSILLVEDEFFLACTLEEYLRASGFHVVGPCSNLAQAMEVSQCSRFDAAILDINLDGEMVFPLADELIAREIPFMFLTGYSGASLPERFRAQPRMAKPYEPTMLIREIGRVLRKPR